MVEMNKRVGGLLSVDRLMQPTTFANGYDS